MLHVSTINQYANMEYSKDYHKFLRNNNISTSNKSSVSTFNFPSVTAPNDDGCSLFILIYEKIQYSNFSKTQSIYVRRESNVMNSHIKLLARKKWRSIILEYLLKDKDMKEVVSEMDIITTFSTQEMIKQNKCRMSF